MLEDLKFDYSDFKNNVDKIFPAYKYILNDDNTSRPFVLAKFDNLDYIDQERDEVSTLDLKQDWFDTENPDLLKYTIPLCINGILYNNVRYWYNDGVIIDYSLTPEVVPIVLKNRTGFVRTSINGQGIYKNLHSVIIESALNMLGYGEAISLVVAQCCHSFNYKYPKLKDIYYSNKTTYNLVDNMYYCRDFRYNNICVNDLLNYSYTIHSVDITMIKWMIIWAVIKNNNSFIYGKIFDYIPSMILSAISVEDVTIPELPVRPKTSNINIQRKYCRDLEKYCEIISLNIRLYKELVLHEKVDKKCIKEVKVKYPQIRKGNVNTILDKFIYKYVLQYANYYLEETDFSSADVVSIIEIAPELLIYGIIKEHITYDRITISEQNNKRNKPTLRNSS